MWKLHAVNKLYIINLTVISRITIIIVFGTLKMLFISKAFDDAGQGGLGFIMIRLIQYFPFYNSAHTPKFVRGDAFLLVLLWDKDRNCVHRRTHTLSPFDSLGIKRRGHVTVG